MPIPPNQTAATATDIGTLSGYTAYSTTQDAWDGSQTVQDLWYSYTPVAGDGVLEIAGLGDVTNYRVTATVWYGPASSPTQIGNAADNRPMQQDIITGVTAGQPILFRFRKAVGNNHNPSTLTLRIARGQKEAIAGGDLFINDSNPGYPGIAMDTAAVPKRYVLNYPAGEGQMILTNGIIGVIDAFTALGPVIYNSDFTVRATPTMPTTGYTDALGSNQVDTFWALDKDTAATSFAISISSAGVVGSALDLGNNSYSDLTPQADNSAIYAIRGTVINKITNPGGVVTLFKNVDAGFAFGSNILMMTDDTLLVSYEKAATTTYIRRFNLSGTEQSGSPYTLTGVTQALERIFADDEDPTYFWVWWQSSTLNHFQKIRVSDGTVISDLSRMKFNAGISQEGATASPTAYSGADFSCVPIVLRAAGTTSSGRRGIYVPTRGVAGSEGGGSQARFQDLNGFPSTSTGFSATVAGRIIPILAGAEGRRAVAQPGGAGSGRAIYVPTVGIAGAEGDGRISTLAQLAIRRIVVYDGEGYTHR